MEKTEKTRRPYHKPQLEQVQLIAEEAVLQGCKTRTGIGGEGFDPCLDPPNICRQPTT
jgi:hypothetical protein